MKQKASIDIETEIDIDEQLDVVYREKVDIKRKLESGEYKAYDNKVYNVYGEFVGRYP